MEGKTSFALILGVAMLLSALVLGLFFYNAQKDQSTVTVVGQAVQGFEADTSSGQSPLRKKPGLMILHWDTGSLKKACAISKSS